MKFVDLGLIDYQKAYDLQRSAVSDVIAGGEEQVFLCEHPSVLTLGRMSDERYILAPREDLAARGIEVLSIDRGGEVTLHAPGQLVVYPILDLKKYGKDLKQYMFQLEETGIGFLKSFGIDSIRNPGKTGVWSEGAGGHKKVISIGVGVKKWVSFHGMGINVSTDLKLFSLINPCGLGAPMASVESLTGRPCGLKKAKEVLIEKIKFNFIEGKFQYNT
ncbi:MAG: lipoyl(octanoyl) transferase LipB [Candidatus Omnitrophica bacterium]|nr:lipoyl(octanoyl) transferase LipB [Candidatus Omnitrophota bacterium]